MTNKQTQRRKIIYFVLFCLRVWGCVTPNRTYLFFFSKTKKTPFSGCCIVHMITYVWIKMKIYDYYKGKGGFQKIQKLKPRMIYLFPFPKQQNLIPFKLFLKPPPYLHNNIIHMWYNTLYEVNKIPTRWACLRSSFADPDMYCSFLDSWLPYVCSR